MCAARPTCLRVCVLDEGTITHHHTAQVGVDGATECVACEASYYQKNTGRNKCHKCNPLENCDGGITCTNNRNQQCETCASGYYRQKDGKGCKKCTDAEHCLPDMSECTAAGAALGEGGMGIDRDRSTCTKWDPNPGMTPG